VFDGVHLGHQEVIAGSDTVLTFEPHPTSVIQPAAAPKLLTRLDVKAELVEELGVQEMVVIPFDDAFAQRSAEDFVSDVLVDALQATHVSVGRNFRFGHKARGDAALLAAEERFETRVCDLVEVEGRRCPRATSAGWSGPARSSTRSPSWGGRSRCEARSSTATAADASSASRPRTSCPTSAWCVRHPASTSAARTGSRRRSTSACDRCSRRAAAFSVEAHLIDFDEDLYGTELRIDFLSRLRGERMFDSVDGLVEQIARDVQRTRELAG